MKELLRNKYLSRIGPFIDDYETIKVLTGVRRCGKSTILKQICRGLQERGVPRSNLVHINLDSKKLRKIKDVDSLEALVDSMMPEKDGQRYLFIDEIQNVKGFEELINAYREEGVSVFITGSNSYLLSGELVTKLTGRYVEFQILPFMLSEIRDLRELNGQDFDARSEFSDYLYLGGYPKRFQYPDRDAQVLYIRSVIAESITKDIIAKRKIKNRPLLEKMINFLISTPGAKISSTSIRDYIRSENIRTTYQTVNKYLDIIFSSKLVSKCERYSIVGKKTMKTLYKAYVADPALHAVYPDMRRKLMMGRMMENIVYNELVSRGYDVTVGKLREKEVDFVVSRDFRIAYVQVAYVIDGDDTDERGIGPLLSIRDNYPKYIISMDPICMDDRGIRRISLVDDFLLGDKFTV